MSKGQSVRKSALKRNLASREKAVLASDTDDYSEDFEAETPTKTDTDNYSEDFEEETPYKSEIEGDEYSQNFDEETPFKQGADSDTEYSLDFETSKLSVASGSGKDSTVTLGDLHQLLNESSGDSALKKSKQQAKTDKQNQEQEQVTLLRRSPRLKAKYKASTPEQRSTKKSRRNTASPSDIFHLLDDLSDEEAAQRKESQQTDALNASPLADIENEELKKLTPTRKAPSLKSCMSTQKSQKTKRKTRGVKFGSPSAAEYVIGTETNKMTPLPKSYAKQRFSMMPTEQIQEQMDAETKKNNDILAKFEDSAFVEEAVLDDEQSDSDEAPIPRRSPRRRMSIGPSANAEAIVEDEEDKDVMHSKHEVFQSPSRKQKKDRKKVFSPRRSPRLAKKYARAQNSTAAGDKTTGVINLQGHPQKNEKEQLSFEQAAHKDDATMSLGTLQDLMDDSDNEDITSENLENLVSAAKMQESQGEDKTMELGTLGDLLNQSNDSATNMLTQETEICESDSSMNESGTFQASSDQGNSTISLGNLQDLMEDNEDITAEHGMQHNISQDAPSQDSRKENVEQRNIDTTMEMGDLKDLMNSSELTETDSFIRSDEGEDQAIEDVAMELDEGSQSQDDNVEEVSSGYAQIEHTEAQGNAESLIAEHEESAEEKEACAKAQRMKTLEILMGVTFSFTESKFDTSFDNSKFVSSAWCEALDWACSVLEQEITESTVSCEELEKTVTSMDLKNFLSENETELASKVNELQLFATTQTQLDWLPWQSAMENNIQQTYEQYIQALTADSQKLSETTDRFLSIKESCTKMNLEETSKNVVKANVEALSIVNKERDTLINQYTSDIQKLEEQDKSLTTEIQNFRESTNTTNASGARACATPATSTSVNRNAELRQLQAKHTFLKRCCGLTPTIQNLESNHFKLSIGEIFSVHFDSKGTITGTDITMPNQLSSPTMHITQELLYALIFNCTKDAAANMGGFADWAL